MLTERNERKKDQDINNQMQKMRIRKNNKIHWTKDTIDNENITTEKSERCHKRKKTPKKQITNVHNNSF
jgi:hypothetical protein